MINRLLNTPMNEDGFNTELETIHEIARTNGYSRNTVDRILNKHKRKRYLQQMSSLFVQDRQSSLIETTATVQRFSIAFNEDVFHKIQSIFRRNDLDIVPIVTILRTTSAELKICFKIQQIRNLPNQMHGL